MHCAFWVPTVSTHGECRLLRQEEGTAVEANPAENPQHAFLVANHQWSVKYTGVNSHRIEHLTAHVPSVQAQCHERGGTSRPCFCGIRWTTLGAGGEKIPADFSLGWVESPVPQARSATGWAGCGSFSVVEFGGAGPLVGSHPETNRFLFSLRVARRVRAHRCPERFRG